MKTSISSHCATQRTVAFLAVTVTLVTLLCACTPNHDWREIRGDSSPYTVLLPAKPASQTRQITLSGTPVMMTMTSAEVDHATYAVGNVATDDPAAAKKIMLAMKAALIGHIDGAIVKEHEVDSVDGSQIDLEAAGSPKGEPRVVVARFVAHDRFAYQVIATGPAKSIARDNIDTFMTSFKVK
jgi:hypothetical protein